MCYKKKKTSLLGLHHFQQQHLPPGWHKPGQNHGFTLLLPHPHLATRVSDWDLSGQVAYCMSEKKNSAISADYVTTCSFRVTSLLSEGTEIQRGPLTAAHLVQGLTRSAVEVTFCLSLRCCLGPCGYPLTAHKIDSFLSLFADFFSW